MGKLATADDPAWQEKEYQLYEYQQLAVDKFRRTRSVLISDDMGLGKTLEAIELDHQRRLDGTPSFLPPYSEGHNKVKPTLIIAPMSVVPEWERHYEWMLPFVRVVCLDAKDRPAFVHALQKRVADVYIMHWDALRLMPELARVQWFHIIGDEIQKVKNRKAQVTKALKKLRTEYKTGLSGTPADNAPQDLWSILNWLYPENWRSYWNFYKAYVNYVVDEVHGYHKITGVRNVQHLRKQMRTFYIRRRKEEVAKDLPEKYYNALWVDLSPTQRRQYNAMKKDMIAWVGEHADKPMPAPVVVTQLLRLQQCAAAGLDMEMKTYRRRSKQYSRELVADFLKVHPSMIEHHLIRHPEIKLPNDRRYHQWYTETLPRYFMIEPSTKIDVAMQLLESTNDSIVFFSHFKQMINLFGKRLEKVGVSHGLLTGDTPQSERGDLVKNFQRGKFQVFAGTIAAGGVGITLTKSSHVTFFDRAWSPSWNRQAEDRLHRIGQENAVQVTDIMARNTIDLGRVQQIQRKWAWLQLILGDKAMDYQMATTQVDPTQQDVLETALQIAFGGRPPGLRGK